MRKTGNDSRMWTWMWLLLGVGVSVGIVVAADLLAPGFPIVTGLGIVLVAMVALLGGMLEQRSFESASPSVAPTGPEKSVERLSPPLAAFAMRVATGSGTCPLGFRPGDQWAVDAAGRFSTPVCEPAARSARRLTSTWTEAVAEPDPRRQATCVCPWAKVKLTFKASPVAATP